MVCIFLMVLSYYIFSLLKKLHTNIKYVYTLNKNVVCDLLLFFIKDL